VRRRTRLIVLVVVLAWIVAAGVLLADAARHLMSGRDTASETVDGIQPSSLLSSDVAEPLEEAAADFKTAHDRLNNPVLTPIRLLPVFGRQLRSVDASADSAGEAVQLAADALRRTRAAVTKPIADGPARLAVIDELNDAVDEARAGMAKLDLGPDEALIGPVRTVHRDLAERVDDARDALARADGGLTATKKLLAGPSRYLVVAANNAEMRGGSGMWLTGGLLTAENGRLELGEMEQLYRVARPADGAVNVAEVDADLQDNWGWMRPDVEWRSLMASPRFVPSAEVAARMWAATGHGPVDGVLVLDAVGLGNLVAATGPVTIDGRTYDRNGIVRELLHDQYVRYQSSFQSDRREALSEVADAVFDRIDAGTWKADELARQLTDSVRGRHLLLWAADATSQKAWAGAGASGTLQTDSLAVSLLNRGGNKLDWFLRSKAALSTERDGDDRVVTLELTYANTVGEGEPPYISGPWPEAGTVKDEYKGVVAVNLPGFARDITLDGLATEIRGDDGPTKLVAGTLRLKRGERATVTVRFRIAAHDTFVVVPSARFQGTPWTQGSTTWRDDRARTVRF
jgi:hypothetical protein